MPFSSPFFLFLFLPIILAGYLLVGSRARNLFLLASSLFFCAWGDGRYVAVLLASILINYFFGILAGSYRHSPKGRLILCLALVANLCPLLWYKYAPFLADNLLLVLPKMGISPPGFPSQHTPLGISFFTFQAIAYLVDVYHEKIAPQNSLPRFALFMALFTRFTAGPIVRYGDVAGDLQERTITTDDFAYGVKRLVTGLGKKVLIADTLAKTADHIFAIPQQDLPCGIAWLGLSCYTLQLYFDFSGYSDMAIGLGRMFGFRIPENFNYPYCARSLTDFWRRWHISLSTWFRDYVFIPLSYALITDRIRRRMAEGTCTTNYRTAFSILVVFTLCGLWHGAGYNFILWGMVHGAVLGGESLWLGKRIKKWAPPLQHMYLLFVVMMAWVLFRAPDLKSALCYYQALLGLSPDSGLQYHLPLYFNRELLVAFSAGVIASTPVTRILSGFFEREWLKPMAPLAEIVVLVLIMIASFSSMASSVLSPFIYQRF